MAAAVLAAAVAFPAVSVQARQAAPTPPAAAKQEEKPKKVADLSLEELMDVKVDEVVSASRFVQKISEAPASVTIVTAEDIKRFGYRTLADILRSIRGVYVTQDRNYSYLGIRGFGLPSDYNNRVLFLVDGHRLNDAVYDWSGVGGEFVLDVDTIDRVEFIRGPASSLYGSSAFFGVINVMTKKGRRLDGPEVSTYAGSFGSYKARTSYGKLFDGGVEMLLSSSVYRSRGQTLYFREYDDPATRNGFVANMDGESYYNLLGQVSYAGLTFQSAYVLREKDVPTAPFNSIFGSRETKTWDSLGFADLKYQHDFGDRLDVLARLHYQKTWYRAQFEFEDTSSGTPVPYVNKDSDHGQTWGAEVVLTKRLADDSVKLSLGAEYRSNFQQDQKNFDEVSPRVIYLDSDASDKLAAVFGQADVRVIDDVRVVAGLRYDHYASVGGSLNPRGGLIVTPAEGTTVKALYGRAFRAPSAYELNYETAFLMKRNPDLDPETIDTYEVVIEQDLGQGLQLLGSLFHYESRGLITLQTDPADGLLFMDNVDKVRTMGVELELRGKLACGVQGSASYSYQEAKLVSTDSWMTNSPRHLAKFGMSVPLIEDRAFAGIELQYMSDRKTASGGTARGYLIGNLTFTIRDLARNLDLSVSAYNFFNTKFYDLGGGGIQDKLQQDGANFRLGLVYRF